MTDPFATPERQALRAMVTAFTQEHIAQQATPVDAALAKQTGVEACAFVTNEAVQIHGGMGYMRESEVERHYRDARILGIGGGATEVMTDLSARLLGW